MKSYKMIAVVSTRVTGLSNCSVEYEVHYRIGMCDSAEEANAKAALMATHLTGSLLRLEVKAA